MTHTSPVLNQEAFSIGKDTTGTGTQSGHNLGTTNANVSGGLADYFYLRIVMKEVNGGAVSNQDYRIEYRKNGGAWTTMDTGVTAAAGLRSAVSGEFTNLTDGGTTTQRIGNGTYATTPPGIQSDSRWESANNSLSMNANEEMEILIPVRFIQSANETVSGDTVPANGDYYEFSIWDTDAAARVALESGSNYPRITAQIVASNTLPIDAGSYATTGQTLAKDARPSISAGSYATTGQAITTTLTKSWSLACDTGTYATTGQTITTPVAKVLNLDAGSYTVSGQTLSFNYNQNLALDAGSYATSGQTITFGLGRTLALDAGSYGITGQPIILGFGQQVDLDAGSYTTTGQTLGFNNGYALNLDAGSYATSGQAISYTHPSLQAVTGSYATTGQTLTLTQTNDYTLNLDAGSYAITTPQTDLAFYIPLNGRVAYHTQTTTDATATSSTYVTGVDITFNAEANTDYFVFCYGQYHINEFSGGAAAYTRLRVDDTTNLLTSLQRTNGFDNAVIPYSDFVRYQHGSTPASVTIALQHNAPGGSLESTIFRAGSILVIKAGSEDYYAVGSDNSTTSATPASVVSISETGTTGDDWLAFVATNYYMTSGGGSGVLALNENSTDNYNITDLGTAWSSPQETYMAAYFLANDSSPSFSLRFAEGASSTFNVTAPRALLLKATSGGTTNIQRSFGGYDATDDTSTSTTWVTRESTTSASTTSGYWWWIISNLGMTHSSFGGLPEARLQFEPTSGNTGTYPQTGDTYSAKNDVPNGGYGYMWSQMGIHIGDGGSSNRDVNHGFRGLAATATCTSSGLIYASIKPATNTKYTLSLDAGSYSTTGQTLILGRGRTTALDAGSYVLSGKDVALEKYVLYADAGSYSVSGQAPRFIHPPLQLDAGSYATTGQTITTPLGAHYKIEPPAGLYSITPPQTDLAFAGDQSGRTSFFAQSETEVATNSTSVWSDCVTLTFPAKASTDYYIICHGIFNYEDASNYAQIRLTVDDTQKNEILGIAPHGSGELWPVFQLYRHTQGGSAGAVNLALEEKISAGTSNVTFKAGSITVIEHSTNDKWVEDTTDNTYTSATHTTVVSTTTATTTPYVVLASAAGSYSSADAENTYRLRLNTSGTGSPGILHDTTDLVTNNTSAKSPIGMVYADTDTNTITYNLEAAEQDVGTATIYNANLLILDAAGLATTGIRSADGAYDGTGYLDATSYTSDDNPILSGSITSTSGNQLVVFVAAVLEEGAVGAGAFSRAYWNNTTVIPDTSATDGLITSSGGFTNKVSHTYVYQAVSDGAAKAFALGFKNGGENAASIGDAGFAALEIEVAPKQWVLSLDAGSYSTTGQTITTGVGLSLSLDAGSYATSGQELGVTSSRALALDTGSYATTGQTITTSLGRTVALDAGAYAKTGQVLDTAYGTTVALDAGSYATAGQTITTPLSHTLNLDAGSYTTTGQTITTTLARTLNLDVGSYATSGQTITTPLGRALGLDAGSYTYTGQTITYDLQAGGLYNIDIGLGTYGVTGQTLTLGYGQTVDLDAGSYASTGQTLSLPVSWVILDIDAGSYTNTWYDLNLNTSKVLGAGSYASSGLDITAPVIRDPLVADLGSYSYSGQITTFGLGVNVSIDLGSYTYTGVNQDPALDPVFVPTITWFLLG